MKRFRRFLKPTVLIILFVFAIYLVPRMIKINNISCKNQYGECNSRILNRMKDFEGNNLFIVKNRVSNVLKEEGITKQFFYHFNLPDKLEVVIEEKKGEFALRAVDYDSFALVDNEGVVISIQKETDLPFIEVEQVLPNTGDKVNEASIFALGLLRQIHYYHQVDRAQMDEGQMSIRLDDGTTAIFPLQGDKQLLVGAFNLVLQQLNSDSENFRIENDGRSLQIDLRYKNPVIRKI